MDAPDLKILGRSDRVDLPGLGIENIQAKIDTGAYTCSLHCSDTVVKNGVLEFVLLDAEHPEFTGKVYSFKKFEQREVKNSFGEAELRYIIKTKIRLHGRLIRAEFSLSNRGNLKFPVLLGRKILRKRFLIDVTKKDLSFLEKTKNP
ncbi:MAG: ATP-dependent zinc protease [Bacteroidetes bacterium]|nr:ATP-dependent zinc protease [Bacteroidota bacterium]MBS1539402.1 ATP-dependent zinc protease [Bacteroidota bacterium]